MLWLLDRDAIACGITDGYGWDFKPLPEGVVAPARMGLAELAERVKGQVNGGKSGDKIAIQS